MYNDCFCITGMACSRGGLVIYSGTDDSGPVIGKYCGQRLQSTVYSRTHQVYITLEGVIWDTEIHQLELSYEAFGKLLTSLPPSSNC